jgi:N-acetyl-gamma-glutamylphosphate reductase
LRAAAEALYRDEPFVRVVRAREGAQRAHQLGDRIELAFLSYAVNSRTGLVVAIGAIDNLGKARRASRADANLMTGQPESAGLAGPAAVALSA